MAGACVVINRRVSYTDFFCFYFSVFFVGFLDRLLSLHTSHWIVCNFLHAGFNRIESIDKITTIVITTTEEKRRQREEERKSG